MNGSTVEIRKLARVAGCTNRIRFRGVRPHAQIIDELPEYVALLLPSVNETFGMVYLEALLAGVPVLYTRGTGIDGHLDGLRVGVGVTAGAVEEIAAAIDDFSCNAAQWRDAVWRHRPDLISRFGQDGIVARYTNDIRSVLKKGQSDRPGANGHDAPLRPLSDSEQASGPL